MILTVEDQDLLYNVRKGCCDYDQGNKGANLRLVFSIK